MRRALLIGIDQYSHAPLQGCVSDATRMEAMLRQHHNGDPNFETRLLTAPLGGANTRVTRPILRGHIEELFQHPADVALLFFAGHGTINGLGGYLVTQDTAPKDEGVALADVLTWAIKSPVREVVVILDSCFSGNMGNPNGWQNAVLREGISILTASRGDQVSVETAGGGLFTSLLVDALDGGAANILGSVSAPAMYAFVEAALGAWDQRPLFKAHVSQVVELRCCKPPIAREVLRRLPQLFQLPAEDLPLDPSFEPSSPAPNVDNVRKFEDLQALNRVHLVTPVNAPHMYDAAMKSCACRLTPSGRYYWRLAIEGRI